MLRRMTMTDITGLNAQELQFVIEYLKDFSPRRAAEAAGFDPDKGENLKARKYVALAIDKIMANRLESTDITPEWVMMELVDNHQIARQQGKITASTTALGLVAKFAAVDAYAADKIMTVTDQAVLERLQRAYKRSGTKDPVVVVDEEVSFL